MTELEKIRKYIERTKINKKTHLTYCMCVKEWNALVNQTSYPVEAVALAFDYGLAKGYRAGKRSNKVNP